MRNVQNLIVLAALIVACGAAQASAASNPLHNPNNPFDVDNNGAVQAHDALLVINQLNRATVTPLSLSTLQLSSNAGPLYFWDTNSDTYITPIDALLVINHLSIVPEPSTLVSGLLGLLFLAGYGWRRRHVCT